MKNIKKLVIERSKWGAGADGGALYNGRTDRMCCLGFLAKRCAGLTKDQMRGRVFPTSEEAPSPFSAGRLAACSAATINDNVSIGRRSRESQLVKLFAKNGITLEFKGRYARPKAAARA